MYRRLDVGTSNCASYSYPQGIDSMKWAFINASICITYIAIVGIYATITHSATDEIKLPTYSEVSSNMDERTHYNSLICYSNPTERLVLPRGLSV